MTGCGHRFHWRCYIEALSFHSRGCPLCRRSVQEAMPRFAPPALLLGALRLGFAPRIRASDSRNSFPLKRLGFAR